MGFRVRGQKCSRAFPEEKGWLSNGSNDVLNVLQFQRNTFSPDFSPEVNDRN
jgi:hypothetical protein